MNASFALENLYLIAEDQIKGFLDFYKAINWRETWLTGLIIFHLLTFISVILTRKHSNVQAVMFVVLLCIVLGSEQLNIHGSKHWRKFSKEQYFDSQGLFITAVLSGPIIFNCFIMMVMWLYTAGKMLIVVGRGRLREKRKQMVKSTEENKKEN
ncbi:transmembrane protein 18 [Exaiptasia diaphana]|uniref:Transmembrane protein 18 n=1 Tax=Exaiptasia diaphana TaxID=2652724 RepID=A0A913WVP4_EXADI|nr:transmembrane protein 18 [Exaiptasia diaphana]KXJ04224.1 Transmembrane protein 18 [Exaiptasia diaphana]